MYFKRTEKTTKLAIVSIKFVVIIDLQHFYYGFIDGFYQPKTVLNNRNIRKNVLDKFRIKNLPCVTIIHMITV